MKQNRLFRGGTCCLVAYLGIFMGVQPSLLSAQGTAPVQGAATAALVIRVIEGEDGVNIIKTKSAVKPVVEVRDRNNLPVAGVTVLFALPRSGASAVFGNGAKTLSLVTNSAGRAAVTGMSPVGTGTFNIGITASFQGQVATATVAQTNFATVAAAQAAGATTGGAAGTGAGTGVGGGVGGGLSTSAIIGIVAGAAAAAAGVAVAKGGGGGGKGPSGTIGVGGRPTLGPPR